MDLENLLDALRQVVARHVNLEEVVQKLNVYQAQINDSTKSGTVNQDAHEKQATLLQDFHGAVGDLVQFGQHILYDVEAEKYKLTQEVSDAWHRVLGEAETQAQTVAAQVASDLEGTPAPEPVVSPEPAPAEQPSVSEPVAPAEPTPVLEPPSPSEPAPAEPTPAPPSETPSSGVPADSEVTSPVEPPAPAPTPESPATGESDASQSASETNQG